jgi:hypothetical protein
MAAAGDLVEEVVEHELVVPRVEPEPRRHPLLHRPYRAHPICFATPAVSFTHTRHTGRVEAGLCIYSVRGSGKSARDGTVQFANFACFISACFYLLWMSYRIRRVQVQVVYKCLLCLFLF